RTSYAWLAQEASVGQLHGFLARSRPDRVILSLDFSANHVVAPFLARCGVDPATGLIVFNHDDKPPSDAFLAAVPAVAPSLRMHARALGQRLAERLQSGSWGPTPQSLW